MRIHQNPVTQAISTECQLLICLDTVHQSCAKLEIKSQKFWQKILLTLALEVTNHQNKFVSAFRMEISYSDFFSYSISFSPFKNETDSANLTELIKVCKIFLPLPVSIMFHICRNFSRIWEHASSTSRRSINEELMLSCVKQFKLSQG